MKSRVQNCEQCRNLQMKAQENLCMECQYDMFESTADDIARATVSAVIKAMEYRGRKPEYIRKLFADIVFVLECPPIFGKQMHSPDMIAEQTEKYGLDFSEIKVQKETKKEFFHNYKKR